MEYLPAKTIVTRTRDESWFGSRYNMNIYRGCCHGCIYCDSRSDCYQVGEFDRVRAKANALEIIRNDLRRKVKTGVVATGAMSDPYNPHEKGLLLTRRALELLAAYGFGVAIATKSDLVVRDRDILEEIRENSPAIVQITVTAADDRLARQVEPFAPSSSRRFAGLEALSRGGIFAGVLLMPVLPFLEDNEENIRRIVRQAAACGARFVYGTMGVTQRPGQREWFHRRLEEQFPGQGLAQRYQRRYGDRYHCPSPRARALWEAFREECAVQGLLWEMPAIIHARRQTCAPRQLSLL